MFESKKNFLHNSRLLWLFAAFIMPIALGSCNKSTDDDGARVLHIGNAGEPLSLNPHQAAGTWENRIISDMFMGLTTDDINGNPVPGVAESWTTSSDGLVWTFKLRASKWSDGQPVTAHDFVYAWQYLFTTKPPPKYASLLFIIKNSQEIYEGKMPASALGAKAIDNNTLQVTLKNPAPYLPGLLTHYISFPIPKHIVEAKGNEWIKAENIATNGAFVLEQWSPNDFVHVKKNQNFWDAKSVCLNELYYYPTTDDSSAARRVKTGKLDMHFNFSGSRRSELDRSLPGYARVSPITSTNYYWFNFKKPPFDNQKVREALSLAVDREFITEKILQGGQTPAYSIVPPGIQGYPSGKISVPFKDLDRPARLERARQLLTQAGYGPSKPLNFTYRYRGNGDNPRVAPVVQQNWAEIAPWVKVEVVQSDLQVHYEILRAGDFEVGDAGWAADFNDARNFLYSFEIATGKMNYGKHANPEYDALVQKSDNERDAGKRAEYMLQAEKKLLDTSAIIPLYYQSSRNLVNPRITGFVDNPNDYHRSRFLCTTDAKSEGK